MQHWENKYAKHRTAWVLLCQRLKIWRTQRPCRRAQERQPGRLCINSFWSYWYGTYHCNNWREELPMHRWICNSHTVLHWVAVSMDNCPKCIANITYALGKLKPLTGLPCYALEQHSIWMGQCSTVSCQSINQAPLKKLYYLVCWDAYYFNINTKTGHSGCTQAHPSMLFSSSHAHSWALRFMLYLWPLT